MSGTTNHHTDYDGDDQYPSPDKTVDLSEVQSVQHMMQAMISIVIRSVVILIHVNMMDQMITTVI